MHGGDPGSYPLSDGLFIHLCNTSDTVEFKWRERSQIKSEISDTHKHPGPVFVSSRLPSGSVSARKHAQLAHNDGVGETCFRNRKDYLAFALIF